MKKSLEQTWRWYGPDDSVTLQDIKQAGATGIVTALHHIPHGEIWPIADIQARKKIIEDNGLSWSVVESLPVHEDIKTHSGNYKKLLENYNQSLANLASCGIKTICYNFMPVLDWTRTQLDFEVEDGAKALRFDWLDLAVFDLFVLKRDAAKNDYSSELIDRARLRFNSMADNEVEALKTNILMGIPGEGNVEAEDLLRHIEKYQAIGTKGLKENLSYFLESITDTCMKQGIKMTIHPDDPPFPILGLPRVVHSKEDYSFLMKTVDQPFNGFCFCTGSLGAGDATILPELFELVRSRVYFVHLRNVKKDKEGNFYEANHLDGDVDMYAVMDALIEENQKRTIPIPFRPDHGHQMLDDLKKTTNPGYSAIGRLRGLAELRGLELGILRSKK